MAKRSGSGRPPETGDFRSKSKTEGPPPRALAVRFSDAETTGPIAEHVIEWFDGKTTVAVTKTDAFGRTLLPPSVIAAKTRTLEARVLRPNADPALAPVLVATGKADLSPRADGSTGLSIAVRHAGLEKIRRAGDPKDRGKKRERIISSIGLSGESLKKRIGETNLDEMMAGYRAGRAMIMNIGTRLYDIKSDGLSPRLRDFIEQLRSRQKCTCEDCESAFSPLAYLAHLLDFTTRHVVSATLPNASVTIAQLEGYFGQKFSALTQSCKASETELSQALIAIEVLENHFVQWPLTAQQRSALDSERAARLLDAYLVLLQRMGISYDDLRLAESAEQKAELAGLLGILPPRVDSIKLDPLIAPLAPNALTAERLASIFGLASGQGTSAPDVPQILTWRYEALSKSWEEEDQPATDELAGSPVIDPDIIGPDDFRNPAAKPNAAAPDGPFDIWLRRRAWLDAAQTTLDALGNLPAKLARMYQPFPYGGQNITSWLVSTPVADFEAISRELLAGTRVDANALRLERDLRISIDAFNRLTILQRKDDLSRAIPPRDESLTAQERAEVADILTGCLKRRAFVRWLAEERTAGIAVDPKHFWAPRKTPAAGMWPRVRQPGEPYVDPAVVSLDELPEGTFGSVAGGLFSSRTTQLANRRNDLARAREQQGFAGCMALGFDWWTVPAGSTLIAEFRSLAQNLSSPATAAAARTRIQAELFMTGEDFAQIAQADQAEQAGERLAAGDYEAVYQILVSAFRRQEFPNWVTQETGNAYWKLLKQKLVPWRASTDDQIRWQQALRAALQPVVVDPDLLYSSDFIFSQRAYSVWLARNTEVDAHLVSLRAQTANARATPPTVVERTAMDAVLAAELQVSSQDLLRLTVAADEGQAVEWRLDQLMLDAESLAELSRMISLAATAAGARRLLDREWETVFAICTQVWKRRERIAAWRDEERMSTAPARPITLSPDFFKIQTTSFTVFPPPAMPPLPAWRATPSARLDWVDKLQSRIDLKTGIAEAWRTALRGAEEMILPGIRDVLLQAVDNTRPLIENSRALEREYLIDFRMGGCATATRVSQAIETIQALLEGLRTSQPAIAARYQIAGNTFDFAAFDEELTWLGSIGRWRSAMFIQVFPEVLLSPSLRSHQTDGFEQLLKSLRSTPRLTPDLACQYAGEYADYFNDVTGLSLAACVRAKVRNTQTSCANRGLMPFKVVEFLVARAPSGKVYYGMRDTGQAAALSYAQTPWAAINKVSSVTAIPGATLYEPVSTGGTIQRSIAVLLKVAETDGPKLKLISFDLEAAEWSDATDLDLPPGVTDFDAAFISANPQSSSSERPQVDVAPMPVGKAQYRFLNRSLSGWDGQSFLPRQSSVEILLATNAEMNWTPDMTWQRNAVNTNRATEWAKASGFVAAIPTFRTNGGKQEIIAFDGKALDEYPFDSQIVGPGDSRVPWGSLEWSVRDLSVSSTAQLLTDDSDTVRWFQAGTTSARAVADKGYLAAFPQFELDIEAETSLEASNLPFQVHAFKGSDFVTKSSVRHQALNTALFTNLGVMESPVAGFHRAVHEYAVRQGYVAGIPTWWAIENGNSVIGKNIVDETNIPANYEYEILLFRTGDGLKRIGSSCANLTNWRPLYPGGGAKFAYYHKATAKDLSAWRLLIGGIYDANGGQTPENLNYIDEASYFVPMMLAIRLHQAGEFDAALDRFRHALDWSLGTAQGIQKSRFLFRHSKVTTAWNVTDDWLRDPLHPHAIAATRPRAYARFTYFAIIRCYLDYADAEFTAENTAKAKRLYRQALDLLDAEVFRLVDPCAPKPNQPQLDPNVVGQLDNKFKPEVHNFYNEITPLEQDVRGRLIKKFEGLVLDGDLGPGLPKLQKAIDAARDKLPGPLALGEILTGKDQLVRELAAALPSHEDSRLQLELAIDSALIRQNATLSQFGPADPRPKARNTFAATAAFRITLDETAPELSDVYGIAAGYGLLNGALNPFCIPVNPLMRALRLHAEVNIHKIENCRNIAGMKRALDLYGAPTDTSTGMPSIGDGGQLVMPGTVRLAPTQYRFRFLIERSRQLVQLAQQAESALFSLLSQRDAAAYTLFKAGQDVRVGRAELTLQDLRLSETQDEFTLAEIQQERALFAVTHFSSLLNSDLNAHELASLILTGIAATHSVAASAGYFGTYRYVEGISAAGQAWSQKASIAGMLAQFERRREEWRYQRTLAQYDWSTANQQVVIAGDRVQISTQERSIAELKTQLSEDTVEYLTNKQFVTEEVIDSMVDIRQGVTRSLLQQTTSVARLAASQLAFERQEQPPEFIRSDYWTVRDALSDSLGQPVDRGGLTGSARLQNDIELLNQHALDTDKRKLHLTKIISLAQLAPLEFEQFRKTGILTVTTPMSLFDQDFPGQYLRLVKRVRVSLIALIPPTAGIKATLTASATSRVVVGGDLFQTIRVQHGPDLVALTSTQNATGVFDFDVQPEMLAPFEGAGVDTTWEFRLPKAANSFNYNTIADVLLTLDYSALFSYDYRSIVLDSMRPTLDAERGFSFRHDFADAWYDLLNPGLSPQPMTVRFRTTYDDFPANLDRLTVRNVTLAFMRQDGLSFEIPIAGLRFTPDGDEVNFGGAANTTEGIASTRRGNAQTWTAIIGRTPCGTWELALPNSAAIRNRFSSGAIENVILMVSYSGRKPAWV